MCALSLSQSAILTGSALACWTLWIIVWRLYLSPVAHIPGPRLAALTRWYECYYDCFYRKGGGYYPFKLKELHRQYGPIIRVNPTDVHISDPEFLDQIYAVRDRNSPSQGSLMLTHSMGLTEDFHHHRLRREAANPYFSLRAVMDLESRIRDKVEQLGAVMVASVGTGEPLNLSDAYFAFANDFVRSYSFGADNGLLSDLEEANVQRENLTRLLMGTRFRVHFRWVADVAQLLPLTSKAPPPAVMDLLKFRANISRDIAKILAEKSEDVEKGASIFHDLRNCDTLPPEEKTLERLRDEATLIVMAGTESTSKALSIATFYLLHQREVLHKLRAELTTTRNALQGARIPLADLMNLRYLNAVIHETHRLSFGVTNRSQRYSPTKSLVYTASHGPDAGKSYVIPPRTVMSCVTLCTHTNETLFPDPWTFDPERWIVHKENERAVLERRKRAMHALGKGHRRCIGIHLAQAALCLAIERLVEFDMELFATEEDDVKFIYDQQVSQPRLGSKGVRVLVSGVV